MALDPHFTIYDASPESCQEVVKILLKVCKEFNLAAIPLSAIDKNISLTKRLFDEKGGFIRLTAHLGPAPTSPF